MSWSRLMTTCRITVSAKILSLLLALLACGLSGCNRAAIPGLGTPDLALSTPAPLPGPGRLFPPGAGRAPPGVPVVPHANYTLDAGDRVRIIVFGQENLSNVYTVSASGTVSVPLIGQVRARGLTASELARQVASRLRSQYIKDPKVTAEVITYRPFYILGEVTRPGQYPFASGLTVENAVAIAEGYTPRAKQRFVRLTRKFDGVMSTVMVPTDYPVQPGDTIYVLQRLF
jgi:polysaccharide biosynthesis/export protein